MPKRTKSKEIDTWDYNLDSRQIKAEYECRKAIFERIKPIYEKDLALFKEAEAKYIKHFGKKEKVS